MLNKLKNYQFWLYLQALALLAGNVIGWSTISKEVNTFCDEAGGGFGSLLTFSGTVTTNPLLTPCFWGSIVFLITLAWTLTLILEKNKDKILKSHKKLVYLLGGGTVFALVNNIPVFYNYYTKPPGSTVSCSADRVLNPFATSCFLGLAAFFAAFICSLLALHFLKNKKTA